MCSGRTARGNRTTSGSGNSGTADRSTSCGCGASFIRPILAPSRPVNPAGAKKHTYAHRDGARARHGRLSDHAAPVTRLPPRAKVALRLEPVVDVRPALARGVDLVRPAGDLVVADCPRRRRRRHDRLRRDRRVADFRHLLHDPRSNLRRDLLPLGSLARDFLSHVLVPFVPLVRDGCNRLYAWLVGIALPCYRPRDAACNKSIGTGQVMGPIFLRASRSFPRQSISFSAASTSWSCPSGFTRSNTRAIFPSGPMMNVVRATPMYFLPYMLFSPHTPYFSDTAWSSSASSGKLSWNFSANFVTSFTGSGLTPNTGTPSFW